MSDGDQAARSAGRQFGRICGVALVIAGALLALHGLDVLPGASPEAQPRYAAAGVAMIVGGALLAWLGFRK